ncbi:MAG: A/G-specific adenine glycosylase, partial [Clostridia bacterium]|nr:A/G-specific adenine glycosylase [Clostridia bacterium]
MSKDKDMRLEEIPAPLLSWYRANKRDLPWRHNPTPYRVWVSEIMLQQTRVEAAKEYYIRFLRELPDIYALADCSEEKLLKLWEGLGYYSRVRNMQKAAKEACEKYGGNLPDNEKDLKKLSGIGEYTVGAILSIAYGKRIAAVDGNVLRVISRYAERKDEISSPLYRKELKEKLTEIYPEEGVACSDFTQSLMELGALICLPQNPKCEICPLQKICMANAHSTQREYPVLPEKKAKKEEEISVFVIVTEKGISVRKREKGVLKGMNEFPSEQKGKPEGRQHYCQSNARPLYEPLRFPVPRLWICRTQRIRHRQT